MIPAQVIRTKRDGGELSDDELRAFVEGVTDGSLPDRRVEETRAEAEPGSTDDETWSDSSDSSEGAAPKARVSLAVYCSQL